MSCTWWAQIKPRKTRNITFYDNKWARVICEDILDDMVKNKGGVFFLYGFGRTCITFFEV